MLKQREEDGNFVQVNDINHVGDFGLGIPLFPNPNARKSETNIYSTWLLLPPSYNIATFRFFSLSNFLTLTNNIFKHKLF
jgi:hypothetical protein